jgi:sialic acid synthase SpsE
MRIGDRVIGPGHPVFVIAEIGYNYNTMDEALRSIDAAVESGADAVKFQTFRAETVASRSAEFPEEAGATNQFDEFKRYELSEEGHRELFDYARRRGTIAFSTPSYFDDVELLERLDVPAHKVGSDDLTNLPFLEHVAKTGRPMIFSSGRGTLTEVVEAYEAVRATGNENIGVLHCVSNYPIKDLSVVNLRVIETYRRLFDVPIGFSDHTTTRTAAIAAVAMGASIIERHFTLNKGLDVPDAFFSTDPVELAALVAEIRQLEAALGDGYKRPTATENAMRTETRKSVIARRALAEGELVTPDSIIVKRPGWGIAPKLAAVVVGRRTRRAIDADEAITWDMLA